MVALELAANDAWPAPVQERLGDWVLRAADGWTGRANSALAVGDPGRPLPAAVDAVRQWYAARGRPALINTPLPLAAPLGRVLDEHGWSAGPPVLVQTAALTTLLDAAGPTPAGPATVELAGEPSDPWLAVAAARKSGLPAAAWHVLTAVDRVRFAHGYADDGELLAVARGTVTGGGRWLGLFLVEVLPAARRRGLARQLIWELAEWGAGLGADRCFLQVLADNTPAVTLYRRLGFTTHHSYRTRTAPGCDPGGRC